MNPAATKLTTAERGCLLKLARAAIKEFTRSGGLPQVDDAQLTST
jgi:hypothetical protein